MFFSSYPTFPLSPSSLLLPCSFLSAFPLPSLILLRNQTHYVPLNLNRVQYLIDSGRIDASQPVNMHTLQQSGAVGRIKHGVKLLATVSSSEKIISSV